MLDALARSRREGGVAPELTLLLASGAALRGRPLALEDDVVTLTLAAPGGRREVDLAYVELGSLQGVRVHDAHAVAHLLTFGAVDLPAPPPPGAPEPPTRLKLRRAVEAVGERAAAQLGVGIELDPAFLDGLLAEEAEARRVTALTCDDLFAALEALARDPDGREALEPLKTVRLTSGHLAARRDGDVLVLAFQASLGLSGRPTLDALSDALERAL